MFKKKKEENMDLSDKEEEIIDSYSELDEEIEEDEEDDNEESMEEEYTSFEEIKVLEPRKESKFNKIVNIIFVIIMIALILVTIDVISVGRFNKGPFFAIPVETYKDGGTKVYYGLGYKVISYNQIQGRRDKEIGTWSLKYSTEATTIEDLDLAIEFTGKEAEAYSKYYKKFVRVISTLKKVDQEKHTLTMGYVDEDGKYNLDIICKVVDDQSDLTKFETEKEITIIGTVSNFKEKTDKQNNRLYVSNCFAEQ